MGVGMTYYLKPLGPLETKWVYFRRNVYEFWWSRSGHFLLPFNRTQKDKYQKTKFQMTLQRYRVDGCGVLYMHWQQESFKGWWSERCPQEYTYRNLWRVPFGSIFNIKIWAPTQLYEVHYISIKFKQGRNLKTNISPHCHLYNAKVLRKLRVTICLCEWLSVLAFYVTCIDIQLYTSMWGHRCAGGLKK